MRWEAHGAGSRGRCSLPAGHGICFFAPLMYPAMRRVQPSSTLGRRTVFNVLGPLTNPALAPAQVLGVYATELVPLVAESMVKLGGNVTGLWCMA